MTYTQWKARIAKKEASIKQIIPWTSSSAYYARDAKLEKAGLLEWERFWLVAHRLDTTGMKEAIAARKKYYNSVRYTGMSRMEYRAEISRKYKSMGWTFNNGNFDPFKMMSHYISKENRDVTPMPKHKKKNKDYRKAKALTLAKKEKYPAKRWQRKLERRMLQ